MQAPDTTGLRLVKITDERTPLAQAAFELIHEAMWDVHPIDYLLAELEETRRGLAEGGDYHLFAFVDDGGEPVATASGVYMEAVNAGFIGYLAVREDQRGRLLGRALRAHLVESMRAEARAETGRDLAWVVGEVRSNNRWLGTLVREGKAIPFDLKYFHPWMSRRSEGKYVLYREPVEDLRPALPPKEVAELLYAIWDRAYRIRFPLQSDTFNYMLQQIEGRESVGADPEFAAEADG